MQYHYSVSAVKFVFRPQTDRVQIHEQRNNRIHSHAMKGRKRLTRVHWPRQKPGRGWWKTCARRYRSFNHLIYTLIVVAFNRSAYYWYSIVLLNRHSFTVASNENPHSHIGKIRSWPTKPTPSLSLSLSLSLVGSFALDPISVFFWW